MLVNRDLFKIKIQRKKFDKIELIEISEKIKSKLKLSNDEIPYFVFQNSIINNAYNPKMDNINILLKNGETLDIKEAADTFSISALATPVKKWFLCFPKY
jgi:predicted nuclease with TOPRIM domain